MNNRSRRWLSGILATCGAALAAGWLSACATPQAALEESADFKARIVQQIRTTAAEDERDFAELAKANADEVWAKEALKYWNHAHRDGMTSETLAEFVKASAEATRANLATAERRRALRVHAHARPISRRRAFLPRSMGDPFATLPQMSKPTSDDRPRKPSTRGIGEAKPQRRKKSETEDYMVEGPGQAQAVKRAIHAALVLKVKERKKLTAADYAVLREWEAEEKAREHQGRPAVPGPMNLAVDPECDVEEWVTRDGVVRGQVLSLPQLAQRHELKLPDAEKLLVKVERKLLIRYGFEGSKKRGPLSGAERQALQWVVSIEQLRRASQEWELETETIRRSRGAADRADLDRLAGIVETVKKLADRRDSLVLKVRELGAKERRIGTGRGQKGVLFAINIGELKD